MNLPPLAVARIGVYAAVGIAALSVWLGMQAGASLEFAILRAVFVFVIFTALGFAAEAILTFDWQPGRNASHDGDSSAGDEQA